MENISYYVSLASFAFVILTWFIFAATFLLRKKPAQAVTAETKRAPKSVAGIALQGVGFGLVWAVHRTPVFSPFFGEQYILNIALQILAVLLVVSSVWLARSAIRELGKQWSFQARLIEGHKLVTSGVYQIVRHPIYTAMFGMLLATAIVKSHWLVLLIAAAVFFIGTKIRTNSEEKLLRDEFPADYREYAARVPALIPFLRFL